MKIEKTHIEGCYTITPKIFYDGRGYFFESYNHEKFTSFIGKNVDFVQDNQSFSTKGVLRGLHFQKGEYAQAKLVRVLQGKVLDVTVDLRKDSPSYLKVFTMELSDKNNTQVFMPRGCAHGFVTLSESAIFSYKCDNYYNKASEGGMLFNDPFFNIDWKFPEKELIISEKDLVLPTFKELKEDFIIKS
ncbi:dTDP-4-dehydrorhamnose 3,5-epimerase [Maribacter sp. ANRC-HE7]|uniref:dTDP-4-dehydrorhamnose 3,5-epimerase n=1 Tax=Maribacter aquimaris TaxID=2737171 RepID=A0ABR7UWW4_9FLAO|nr:dTDP-4-dehydrorhamnose 3,5-epimerase [Maribacter aquimaris]MBD0776938.1 dTDP-4-dehydrorhamnose 3,5-epimerase [Maribacter aquimaris]